MSLGRLLDEAMASGKVHAAELTISTTIMNGIIEYDDDKVFRALAGYGRRFKALFDGCPAAFAGLTRLTMENMMVREAVLDDILTTCTKLEFLSLQSWDPGRRTTQWRVRHDRLADLRITFCVFGEVHLVWLPRLERFAYRYNEFHTHEPLSFGHVPRLTTLTVSNNHHVVYTVKLSNILANTSVQDLRLNFSGKDIWVQPEAPKRLTDVFRSLKYLKLHNVHEECGLNWTMFLLQAAPFLKELYIKLWWDHECNMQRLEKKNVPWDVPTDFKHYSLTRITIQGFYSSKDLLATYICRLVGATINLRELRMRENATCNNCYAARTRFPRIDEDREWLVKRITDGVSTPFKIHIVES
ncbi:hypothetical protein QOZ80_8AG0615050 [Eleusine coracana subsp. coracana]|nr:hypothetical protein QOZ80_8AG0615050 [Eleusine coracana subsp. coracana]